MMPDEIATGANVGPRICGVFGLDPTRVVSLKLSVAANAAVRVEVEMVATIGEVDALGIVLADYELVPRDKAHQNHTPEEFSS